MTNGQSIPPAGPPPGGPPSQAPPGVPAPGAPATTPKGSKKKLVIGILIGVALVLGACVALVLLAPSDVDTEEIEEQTLSELRDLYAGSETEIDQVTCPEEVKAEAGTEFTCQVTFVDDPTVVDADYRVSDDEGNVEFIGFSETP